jgi:hypothetical protein
VSAGMDHRRRVPEDLMGTILGEGSGASGEERTFSETREFRSADQNTGSRSAVGEGTVSWEEHPERVGITFNLSKQLSTELDKLRLELESDVRTSRSEIAEVALRLAVEDVRGRGRESELVKRLRGRHPAQVTDAPDDGGPAVRRSVDEAGSIVETTYDENGEIVDEDVIGSVAELPVEAEYVDEKGRLVSLAKDELGNTFEQIMDEELNILGTRLLLAPSGAAGLRS